MRRRVSEGQRSTNTNTAGHAGGGDVLWTQLKHACVSAGAALNNQ